MTNASIAKDEDRSQPLRQRKHSVRDKLQKAAPAPKAPGKKKSKDMEL